MLPYLCGARPYASYSGKPCGHFQYRDYFDVGSYWGKREPSQTTHYPEAADAALSPIGSHRHQPEIDLLLSEMAGEQVQSVFTPILAPMNQKVL